ncbi:PucR family transcriptional regulator [Pseudonocardia humida]|uniref:PucR family transcriptional regulator n=1 Tax=Pseudonocardia humida TaxID=2800819 RepID=A0ABT1A6K7_9PSEU|nr:PucR family transcriptional regulator [Pseudonocardia humida]MCO1658643.1 PucR family transcriptional regulator [Pseudonocardia humida]
MAWTRPAEPIRRLLRRGAEIALDAPPEWLTEIEDSTLAGPGMRQVADDPVLNAAIRRTLRSSLRHWALSNQRDPGAPVPASIGPDTPGIARDLVRRGLDESVLHAYRQGQNAAWLRWMSVAFTLTSDPDELRELLDVSSRSIAGLVDATVAAISAQMRSERDAIAGGTHADRREVVSLVLDGAPITPDRASARLGYRLDRSHTAAVVWNDTDDSDLADLERAAEALAGPDRTARPLAVVARAATVWAWIPGRPPSTDGLHAALAGLPGVRVALGPTAHGVEGFRRSHLDALTTQRLIARLRSDQRVAAFDAVQLVSLATTDPEAADRFVTDTLGDLATAPPELRRTVRTYIHARCHAAQAAAALYTHRNTLLRRLARADELLPRPIRENSVAVAVALDIVHWHGSGSRVVTAGDPAVALRGTTLRGRPNITR